ncbi:MAG: hypothetical protein J6S21_03840 [Victivallales bacterium]|nr:hypothetical protein [Victivallales bacterium]
MYNLEYLQGRRFCVVFVKVLDAATGRVQCRCLRGRANLNNGHLELMQERGPVFTVPATALPTIQPSDGTALLRDAEYFCMVKVSDNIDLDGGRRHHHPGCTCGCHDDDDDIIEPIVF